MDARLTPEQLQLQDSATLVLERHGPSTVQDLDDTVRRARLEDAVASTGWWHLRQDDGTGRPLASGGEVGLVATAMGRAAADVPFLGPVLAGELLRLAGVERTDVEAYTVAVEPELDAVAGQRSRGPYLAIDAGKASRALVLVGDGDGWILGVAELHDRRVATDLTRVVATVDAPRCSVLADQRRRLSADDVARWTALGVAITACELVGLMAGANDLAVAYAKDRHQFGVPVGSFQAMQHLLAEGATATDFALSGALYAAWAVDALEPVEAARAASTAKVYAAEAALTVCENAVQVHGGIGHTWECMAHVFLRRALVTSEFFGGVGAHLATLASELVA